MLQIEKIENGQIHQIKVDENVDEISLEAINDLFEEKIVQAEKTNLLAEVHQFPSFDSFRTFTNALKMKFKAIKAVGKYAVLSDKDWLAYLVPVGNFLTPNLPVKHFDLDEKEDAIAWLLNDSIPADDYFTEMDIEHLRGTNIYTVRLEEEIDETGLKALHEILDKRSGKIKLMTIVEDFEGFDSFKAFVEGIKVDIAAFNAIEKYAVVTDKKWIASLEKFADFITPNMQLKVFKLAEQEAALHWLEKD